MLVQREMDVLARAKASVKGFSCEWDSSQSLFLYGNASNLNERSRNICAKVQAVPSNNHDWLLALQTAGL